MSNNTVVIGISSVTGSGRIFVPLKSPCELKTLPDSETIRLTEEGGTSYDIVVGPKVLRFLSSVHSSFISVTGGVNGIRMMNALERLGQHEELDEVLSRFSDIDQLVRNRARREGESYSTTLANMLEEIAQAGERERLIRRNS